MGFNIVGTLAAILICFALDLMKDQFVSCMNQLVAFQHISSDAAHWGWLSTIEETVMRIVVGTDTEMGIMGYLSGIGLAIAMAYFAIAIIQMAMEDKLTPEQMIKAGAKLAISIGIIMWSPAILEKMFNFGKSFADMFGSSNFDNISVPIQGTVYVTSYSGGIPTGTVSQNYYIADVDMDWAMTVYFEIYKIVGTAIAALSPSLGIGLSGFLLLFANIMLMMLLSSILIPIIQLCVMFVKLTRIIELGVRGALMPIAAGLMADDGWRGAGGRYVRKLLALCIQLGIVNLTMAITGIMMQAVIVYNLVGGLYNILFQGVAFAGVAVDSTPTTIDGFVSYMTTVANNSITSAIMVIEQLGASGINVVLGGLCVAIAGIGFMFKSLRVAEDLCGV